MPAVRSGATRGACRTDPSLRMEVIVRTPRSGQRAIAARGVEVNITRLRVMLDISRLTVKMWPRHKFTVLRLKKLCSKGIRLVECGFPASTINKIRSKNWANIGQMLMKVIYGGNANRVSPLNLDPVTPKIRFLTSDEVISLVLMHNIHMQPVPRKFCNRAAMS